MRWQGRVEPVKVSYDVQSGGSWGLCWTCFLIIGLLSLSAPVPSKWRWNEIKFRNCENKKNNFFFVSSMKTDKKKKQKSLRQKWLNAAELRNRLFFFLFFSPMQELSHRCSHRQRRTLFEFLETFCFHKNMSPIHFRGNWLVHVYHIALNKASEWKWS